MAAFIRAEFNKATRRWTILGTAAEVRRSADATRTRPERASPGGGAEIRKECG